MTIALDKTLIRLDATDETRPTYGDPIVLAGHCLALLAEVDRLEQRVEQLSGWYNAEDRKTREAHQAIDEVCAALEDTWRRYCSGDTAAVESMMLRAAYARALRQVVDLSLGRRQEVLIRLQEYSQWRKSQP